MVFKNLCVLVLWTKVALTFRKGKEIFSAPTILGKITFGLSTNVHFFFGGGAGGGGGGGGGRSCGIGSDLIFYLLSEKYLGLK